MPFKTYDSLPIEILYQLLTIAVRDLIAASDPDRGDPAAFNALKKHVETLLDIIDEKRNR